MPAQPTPHDEAWICPFCQKNDNDFLPEKLQFHCGRCHALGKHLSFVKQVLAKNAFANLNTVLAGPTIPHAVAHCPECRKRLFFFPINTKDRKNIIAACLPCRWVWSDAVDFLHAFANTAPGHIERAEIKVLNRERESAVDGDFHDRLDGQGGHTTRYVEGTMNNVLGPINQHDVSLTAYNSFKIVAACVAVTLLAWKLPRLLPFVVFDPRHPLRNCGLPILLSGFMHLNFMHLLGNSIAILTTGWILENELKRPRNVLWIFLGSVILGNLMHAFFAMPVAVAGASGGARGLLAFYCVMFPWTHFTVTRNLDRRLEYYAIFRVAAPAYLTGVMFLDFMGGWAGSQIYQMATSPLPVAPNIQYMLGVVVGYLSMLTPGWQVTACFAHIGGALFGLFYGATGNCEVRKPELSVSTKAPSRMRDGNRRNPIPAKQISGFPNGISPAQDPAQVYTAPMRKEKV